MAGNPVKFPAAPAECPVCGEEVPRNAHSCPQCGADHNSGWKEEADVAALGLPDDNFRYQEWVEEEFGRSAKPTTIKLIWWVVALILVVAFTAIYLLAPWR